MCRVIHNALFFLSGSSGSFLWGQGTQTALCRDYQLRVNKEEIGRECWRERGREFPSQRAERKGKTWRTKSLKKKAAMGLQRRLSSWECDRLFQRLVPSTHGSWLTATRNSSSTGAHTLFWSPQVFAYTQHTLCSQTQTHTSVKANL